MLFAKNAPRSKKNNFTETNMFTDTRVIETFECLQLLEFEPKIFEKKSFGHVRFC